ncbi:hypothetical protein E1301_Tti017431 [Triplophysa tibetana]|uniref:TRIM8/14/16/25/29/45/65 coiled-coil region domain-containing protein n=1 Tax=Triplophysa tibetana TaxID=1572043 RepID=A0A5A9NIF8_9TELE|nr:hypothetical protein E1301_Tti017431 [Triplophysa tibetana]
MFQSQFGEIKNKVQQQIQKKQKDLQKIKDVVESHKLIRDQETAAVSSAEGLLERLKQEIDDLRRRDAELEKLLHTQHHIHLLQPSAAGDPAGVPAGITRVQSGAADVPACVSACHPASDESDVPAGAEAVQVTSAPASTPGPLLGHKFKNTEGSWECEVRCVLNKAEDQNLDCRLFCGVSDDSSCFAVQPNSPAPCTLLAPQLKPEKDDAPQARPPDRPPSPLFAFGKSVEDKVSSLSVFGQKPTPAPTFGSTAASSAQGIIKGRILGKISSSISPVPVPLSFGQMPVFNILGSNSFSSFSSYPFPQVPSSRTPLSTAQDEFLESTGPWHSTTSRPPWIPRVRWTVNLSALSTCSKSCYQDGKAWAGLLALREL